MDLRQSSRKSSSKGLPGKHPAGTDSSKPQSDQESPDEACSPLSSGAAQLGNSIFTWVRRRANGRKPTVNPTDRRTKPTDVTNSRRAKPTGGKKPTDRPTKTEDAGSRTRTSECHATEIDKV